ncbi:pilus assembly protein TadG-related protein [Novosphingobium sp. KCTC 2891]|uniref:pilus assembly protein TadG-related protein n=1 Tax=Novosphingobium sp. KCTC 2891 TaxID=2989730 RepID=UPI0022225A40|nr:pilus assembly protein TadG-related protein [Novosphingobium sp. KCTC 2891]MCW1381598.1 pilus assembly protein TadG-related protein [Novosphingobium sp. KCTC 2891]
MKIRAIGNLWHDCAGAIAPSYVLSLFAVVAMAGVGYDYAQLAGLDTELQNAADQAALAASTQLTGAAGSRANAQSAANTLVVNNTLLAGNAATSHKLSVASLAYYASQADAESGANATATDATARYVRVTLSARTAKYTLTPIVGLLSSASITASATAGLESTLCKVPPVLICNPSANPATFDIAANVGRGLLLTLTPETATGNSGMTAGQLAFLDPGVTRVTKKNLKVQQEFAKLMGYDAQPSRCISINQPYTQDGNTQNLAAAFNTRFDIYDNPDPIKCYSDGLCSPSDNARKDLVQKLKGGGAAAPTTLSKNECAMGTAGWVQSETPYRPTGATLYKDVKPKIAYPDAMGYPRDLVHAYPGAAGRGRIGNGTWDIDAYWNTNYGKAYASDVSSAKNPALPTRYEVYRWERANGKIAAAGRVFNGSKSAKYADYAAPICKPGITPSATRPDRRVLPAAVVDCSTVPGGAGKKPITPLAWMDVFLVEPTADRKDAAGVNTYTTSGEVYVEIIGPTVQGAGASGSQFTRRDKPFLIK